MKDKQRAGTQKNGKSGRWPQTAKQFSRGPINKQFALIILTVLPLITAFAENRLRNIQDIIVFKDFSFLESEYKEGEYIDAPATAFKPYDGNYLPKTITAKRRMYTFRTQFFIDASLEDDRLSCYIEPIKYPYDIYVNKILIYKKSRYKENLSTSRFSTSIIYLSKDLLRFDNQGNDFVIQIYPLYKTDPLGEIMILDYDKAMEKAFWRNLFSIHGVQGAFILSVFISIFFIYLFITHRYREKTYLYFAFSATFFALAYITVAFQYYSDSLVFLEKISRIGFPFCTIFLSLFLIEYTDSFKNIKKILYTALISLGTASALLILTQKTNERIEAVFTQIMNFVIAPLLLFCIILLAFSVIKYRKKGALIFLFSFFIVIGTSIHDIYYMNIGKTPYIWMVPYGFFALILSIFFVLALERARIYFSSIRQTEELQRSYDVFRKFVPREFLYLLKKEDILDIKLGDQTEGEMSILFSDIRSFTSISEKLTPEEAFQFINDYLKRISPYIRNNNGFIDKYIGDAVMAIFPNNPENAFNTAIQMRKELMQINLDRKEAGLEKIDIGIGINTGHLILGTVGEEERLDGTVIGDAVNIASRLEGLTKYFGVPILTSNLSLVNLPDPSKYASRFLGRIQVKGKTQVISVFEILDVESNPLSPNKTKCLDLFEKGLFLYLNRDFKTAKKIFLEILKLDKKDLPSYRYYRLCEKREAEGVSANWSGLEKINY